MTHPAICLAAQGRLGHKCFCRMLPFARAVTSAPGDLRARVAKLKEEVRDAGLHRACEVTLAELRQLWRSMPALFDEASIASLSEIARTLRGAARPSPEQVLRDVFGYASFRPGQKELIDTVLAGRDALGIMPTGAGKSIAFQVPARVLGGVTLVVSPLIALMKDQVDSLTDAGMRATFLNSSLTPDERRERVESIHAGEIEIVYAAPEGLTASVGSALSGVRLSLIAVDEAHCISTWGHEFRPAYRELSGLKQRFGGVPLLGLTATATAQVTRDIVEQLGMKRPTIVKTSFFRPNLRLTAHAKSGERGRGKSVSDDILRVVRSHGAKSGIVYCLSRKSADSTARFLASHGCRAAAYHAGMDPNLRTRVQDAFCRDDVDVVVATIAFGMGIDKSNVRFVVHRDMPRSIEGYYQEVGRAGRDGLPSDCVMFYSWSEVVIYERFAADAPDEVADRIAQQARRMFRFAEAKGCRHEAIASHFGETMAACKGSCDRCAPHAPWAAHPRDFARDPKAAPAGQDELFERLRALRKRLADERSVPAFTILNDATLVAMAAARPSTPEALLLVPGIGPRKLARYGDLFLDVLRDRA